MKTMIKCNDEIYIYSYFMYQCMCYLFFFQWVTDRQ